MERRIFFKQASRKILPLLGLVTFSLKSPMQYIHRLMIAIMPVVRVVKNLVVLHAVGIATKVAS